MHVYFVRHGESTLNKRYIHQSPNTPLSEKGRQQASTTAEYLRSMNPDLLLSSEYTRALETARIIGMRTGTTPRVNGLFYEIVRPSKLFGKSHFSPVTFWYVIRSLFKKNNPKWRYEDAENFTDLSTRARRALGYLESLAGTHKSVVIVSHTIFVNIMVSYMCKDRLLSFSDLLLTFLHVERMRNGDVVHLEFIGKSPHTCAWRLVSHSKER